MSVRTEEEIKKMEKSLDLVRCQCKYYNKRKYIKIYGTCRGCGRVLDLKAKYQYEMSKKKGWKHL